MERPPERDATPTISLAKPCHVVTPLPAKWYVPHFARPASLAAITASSARAMSIVAIDAINPGCAQDRVLRMRRAHTPLAFLLAMAVCPERCHRIVLGVGVAFRAVEDVIGRDMQERDIQFRSGLREMPRCERIDCVGSLGFALRLVDGGIGGTIDDRARRRFAHIGERGLFSRDVEIIPAGGDRRHRSLARLPHELLPKLAPGADDENRSAHATTPSRSPR